MLEWNGLKVPVYPKKEWADWMLTSGCCPGNNAGIKCGYGKELTCKDCIYARRHWEERRCFYEECYGKPKVQTLFEGLVVPFPPKKEWTWMLSDTYCPVAHGIVSGCKDVDHCKDCIYSAQNKNARASLYAYLFEKFPKLTVEIFNRSDCPEWAQWAAVDEDGKAYWYSKKPEPKGTQWYRCAQNPGRYQQIEDSTRTKFDASDWQSSLIERTAKELPELTATAFHCPDCPKEAAKLKVFPANHVVALDKDDKVLQVMELQCKEGEVNKPKAEWYYNKEADILYYGKDFEYTNPPVGADPVKVSYLPSDVLKGTAVHEVGAAEDFLIIGVNGSLVTLVGINGKDFISMVTLILNYRITCSGDRCCVIEPLQ